MVDSHLEQHSNPTPAPHHSQTYGQAPGQAPDHRFEGTDPDLPAHPQPSDRRFNVSTVQVGASAAAAVTSALAASFFGVAGTLIGAGIGSIVSTIAGALYAEYLHRASRRIRVTQSVIVQRIPGDVLASTPLRHLTGPADLPGEPSMRPIGDETGRTTAMPLLRPRPWWKRPVVSLTAVGLAGFAIALGAVTAIEVVKGGRISGGSGAPSVIDAVRGGGRTTPAKKQVTPVQKPSGGSTATASPTSTPVPTATTGPTRATPAQASGAPATTSPSQPTASAAAPTTAGATPGSAPTSTP
jgi:hypothetical protein